MSRSEYDELRAGFTAAVSHELRTPLARLLALLESAELPGADLQALLRQAHEEVEEMTELVDDILFLSELEQDREVVSLGETEAAPVLRELAQEEDVVHELRHLLDLLMSLPQERLQVCSGELRRLEQREKPGERRAELVRDRPP